MKKQSSPLSDYICPQCATFNVIVDKGFICTNCGHIPRRHSLKSIHDYARYVFLYGHIYRTNYQKQIEEHGVIKSKYCIEPDSLYTYIGLAMLSGVLGNLAWELVKNAARKIVESYNDRYQKNANITEEELYDIYKSFEIFLNHFSEIDKGVWDAIFEEIFAHESGKHDKAVMINNLNRMATDSIQEKERLQGLNEKLAKKVSKELRRRLEKLKQAEEENFEEYWGKIKIEE